MNARLHPDEVLYQGAGKPFPALNACEHYAGNEKLIRKALELQAELGPVFDITGDCEDGAPADAPWLARLQPGTPVTLRVSSDSRPHLFHLERRQEIARTQTEFLDPHRPGLTIALKTSAGAGDTRLLLQGTEEIVPQIDASPVTEGR